MCVCVCVEVMLCLGTQTHWPSNAGGSAEYYWYFKGQALMFVCSGFTTSSLGIDKERGQFTFIYSENKRFGFNMDGQTSSILFIPWIRANDAGDTLKGDVIQFINAATYTLRAMMYFIIDWCRNFGLDSGSIWGTNNRPLGNLAQWDRLYRHFPTMHCTEECSVW